MKKKLLSKGAAFAAVLGFLPVAVISCSTNKKSDLIAVTDSGTIDDKSFNQQGMEAVEAILGRKHNASDYMKPTSPGANDIADTYKKAAQAGKKFVFAPGYYHAGAIKAFNDNEPELSKKINFIAADVNAEALKLKNTIGLLYKVEQAGFLAGYLSAKYLVEIKKDTDPRIGIMAGGNFAGANNQLTGFVNGVKYFNDNKKAGPDVKFVGKQNGATVAQNKAWANSEMVSIGFDPLLPSKANPIITRFKKAHADIVLTSAGPMTQLVIKALGDDNTWKAKLIGVDTDMSKQYKEKNLFLTSIIKKVKESMVGAYKKANEDGFNGWGENIMGDLNNNGWVGISDPHSDNPDELAKLKALKEEILKDDKVKKAAAKFKDSWSDNKGNEPVSIKTGTNAVDIFASLADNTI